MASITKSTDNSAQGATKKQKLDGTSIAAAPFTEIPALQSMVNELKSVPQQTIPLEDRKHIITRIKACLIERADDFRTAEFNDLRRDAGFHDKIRGGCVRTCDYYLENLDRELLFSFFFFFFPPVFPVQPQQRLCTVESTQVTTPSKSHTLFVCFSLAIIHTHRHHSTLSLSFPFPFLIYKGLAANQPCDPVPPPLPGSRARRSYVRHEPRGLALVIGTWNFPLPLHLKPIVTAIAAGCPSFLKCNDQCVETSAIMLRVLGEEYLEADPICKKYASSFNFLLMFLFLLFLFLLFFFFFFFYFFFFFLLCILVSLARNVILG